MGLPSIGVLELFIGLLVPIAFFGGLGLLAYVLIRPQEWRPYTGPDRDRQAAALLALFLGPRARAVDEPGPNYPVHNRTSASG